MSYKLVALKIRVEKGIEQLVQDRRRAGDAGQGTLEYVGMIIVAAVIIGVVFQAIKGTQMGAKVAEKINGVLGLS